MRAPTTRHTNASTTSADSSEALAESPSGIRVLEVPVSRADRRAEAAWLRIPRAAGRAAPRRPSLTATALRDRLSVTLQPGGSGTGHCDGLLGSDDAAARTSSALSRAALPLGRYERVLEADPDVVARGLRPAQHRPRPLLLAVDENGRRRHAERGQDALGRPRAVRAGSDTGDDLDEHALDLPGPVRPDEPNRGLGRPDAGLDAGTVLAQGSRDLDGPVLVPVDTRAVWTAEVGRGPLRDVRDLATHAVDDAVMRRHADPQPGRGGADREDGVDDVRVPRASRGRPRHAGARAP